MTTCIFDRDDKCTHDCDGCTAYRLQCENCGADGESDVLFDKNGAVYCLECLIEEDSQDLYADFAAVYSDEFREFFAKVNADSRVAAPHIDFDDDYDN